MTARITWWRWFVPLVVLGGAWSLAVPLMSGPDEPGHVYRVAALSHGDLLGHEVSTPFGLWPEVRVPGRYIDLAIISECFADEPLVTPTCVRGLGADNARSLVLTGVTRYPPLYYALLAPPLSLSSSFTSLHLARLITVVASAAFFASAFTSSRLLGRWAVVGVAAAATPMAFYLSGVVNPSGLEIASSIALWASATALALAPRVDERLLARTAIAFAVCANSRGLGPAIAIMALFAPLVLARRERLHELRQVRNLVAWCSLMAVSLVGAIGWALTFGRSGLVNGGRYDFTFVAGLGWWPRFAQQSIAWFGRFEVRALSAIAIWLLVYAVLLILAAIRGTARDRLVIASVMIITALLPIVIAWLRVPPFTGWQGRYGMPLSGGVFVMCGAIASTRSARWSPPRAVIPVVAVALGLGQLFAFATAARRYSVGVDGPRLYLLHPDWNGPVPAAMLLLLVVVAITVLTWEIATSRVEVRPADAPPERSRTPAARL